MKLDIKTTTIEPLRQTYSHLARRFGEDRPATRYEEAVMDVQPTANFHYRPLWAPEFELYDAKRTAVRLADPYVLTDPRQYYYGSYNIMRAGMDAASRKAFDMVEERGLLEELEADTHALLLDTVVALRHFEWGANMNNWNIADLGYGAAITSAAAFCAADRLGIAQLLSKVGLLLDGQTGDGLAAARTAWLEAEQWQGIRHAIEDTFVLDDWFECFIAQNLVLDGIVHPLIFDELDTQLGRRGAAGLSMLTEMPRDWFKEHRRWVDATTKAAATESDANRALIAGWFQTWRGRAIEAAEPLARHALGEQGTAALSRVAEQMNARVGKLGIGEA